MPVNVTAIFTTQPMGTIAESCERLKSFIRHRNNGEDIEDMIKYIYSMTDTLLLHSISQYLCRPIFNSFTIPFSHKIFCWKNACVIGWSDEHFFATFENEHIAADRVHIIFYSMSSIPEIQRIFTITPAVNTRQIFHLKISET